MTPLLNHVEPLYALPCRHRVTPLLCWTFLMKNVIRQDMAMGIGPRRTGIIILQHCASGCELCCEDDLPQCHVHIWIRNGQGPIPQFLTVCDSWTHLVGSKSKIIEKARNHLSDQDTCPQTPEAATCQCSTLAQHRPRAEFTGIIHRNYQVMTPIRELFPSIKKLVIAGGGAFRCIESYLSDIFWKQILKFFRFSKS